MKEETKPLITIDYKNYKIMEDKYKEIERLNNIIDRAVNIYEESIVTEDFSTTDLDMYIVLTGQEDKYGSK